MAEILSAVHPGAGTLVLRRARSGWMRGPGVIIPLAAGRAAAAGRAKVPPGTVPIVPFCGSARSPVRMRWCVPIASGAQPTSSVA